MKKIGIIGGLAWPSTADYYRLLCTKTAEHFRSKGASAPYPTPHMIMESFNMIETRELRGNEGDDASWQRYDALFRQTFMRLRDAGADFGIIASNTPHMRLQGIMKGLDFPIVSILDTTAETVRRLGGKRALILGTPVTMKSPVYPDTLRQYGIEALPRPSAEEIENVQKIIDVLYEGEIGATREKILEICSAHVKAGSADVVCLACTELPLAFPEHGDSADFKVNGISFVNTTVAHVDAALREALSS